MPDKLTDSEIVKTLNCVLQLNNGLDKNNAIIALDLINHLEGEKEKNENIIRIADKTIATLNAEIRHLDQESDILRADVENLNRICDEVNAENESLKAEVENLRMVLDAVEDHIHPLPFETDFDKAINKAKTEAYKEFVEKVKNYIDVGHLRKPTEICFSGLDVVEMLDNLLND